MARVFVLDNIEQPLSPCSPARARMLLRGGNAAVYRRFPFTIILKHRVGGEVQPMELKLDPGSKITGIALVQQNRTRKIVIWAAELKHRGEQIRQALLNRRAVRRNRRNRKTRYRQSRFLNRTRTQDWLPPSLRSRVDNVFFWAKRLQRLAPVTAISVEMVRFDMQKLENLEISGAQYQQGTLFGFEVKEYLLEKFARTCVYCGKTDVPLEIEHVVSRRQGGSNRINNLVVSCRHCNERKSNQNIRMFLKDKPELLKCILEQLKRPLKDAAAVNTTRYAIGSRLKELRLPTSFGSGGRTKYNRVNQNYPKTHWIDAACVGETGAEVELNPTMPILQVKATGRGSRQMCRVDRYGFPRTGAKSSRTVHGFKTGDMVRAVVPKGKKEGTHVGRVAIRASGSFNIQKANEVVQGISHKLCRKLFVADGYDYR